MRAPEGSVSGPAGRAVPVGEGPGDAAISYSVEPDTVECSARNGPERSVSLTVHAFNPGPEPVACRLISIRMPLGEGGAALTADPSTIRQAPGAGTPWHVGVAGEGVWDCFPLPPQTAIGPAQRASFVLSRVVVNTVPDRDGARLRIREFHGPDSREVELRIVKLPAAPASRPDADAAAAQP
jgi:hypothetical protein